MVEIATSATPILGGTPSLGVPYASVGQSNRWPLRINWGSGIEMSFEFKTDIYRARAGREQRRALRTEPRKAWRYSGLVTLDRYREVFKYATRRYDEISYFADPFRSVKSDSAFVAGSDTLSVPSTLPWWLVEDAMVIVADGDTAELVKVLDTSEPTFRIHGLLQNSFDAGARISLADPVRLAGSTKTVNETRGVATWSVNLEVDPVGTVLPEVAAAGEMFDDRELFLLQPNWREGVEINLSTEREAVDIGRGPISVYSPIPYVDREYRATFLGRSVDAVFEVVDFFRRQYGRLGEFFMPTGTADLKPISALASGTATLTTAGHGDFATHNDNEGTGSEQVAQAIFVALHDGTYVAKKILSVALSGDNSVFTLDSNWASTIALSQIRYVSYLPLCRFAGDTLTVQWLTDGVAQFNLTFRTLEYQEAE